MRTPRFTIAKLMGTVASAAILLAVFRLGSFAGLAALLPFGITAIVARLSGGPSAYRPALWVGAAGTLLLPFLAAIWINHQMWGYFVSRPAVDRRIVNAHQIETISRVESGSDSRGGRTVTSMPVGEVDSFIQVHPQEGDYHSSSQSGGARSRTTTIPITNSSSRRTPPVRPRSSSRLSASIMMLPVQRGWSGRFSCRRSRCSA
jgi:hypothetical protein